MPVPDHRDPVVLAERQLLQVLLQFPTVLRRAPSTCCPDAFSAEAHRAVFDGIRIANGSGDRASLGTWVSAVTEAAPSAVSGLIELAVATLARMDPMTGLPTSRYVEELFDRVRTVSLADGCGAMSEMRRLDRQEPDPELVASAGHATAGAAAAAGPDQGRHVLMGLFDRRRRADLPTEVRHAVPLRSGDRVIAWAKDEQSGGHVVASTHQLAFVGPDAHSSGSGRGTRPSRARGRATRAC